MRLKTDYKDAMYDGQRRWREIPNDDGTVTMIDATTYTQAGDRFGANDINATNEAVNALMGTKNVVLPVAGWSNSYPYKQTITVAGLSATDNPELIKTLTGSEAEAATKAYNKAFGYLFAGETADGGVTIYALKRPVTTIAIGLKGV